MFHRLLPVSLTNNYTGMRLALWLLLPILLMKSVIAFNLSGLNPFVSVAEILRTVDGVPIDTFAQSAATAVLESTEAWGMAMLALCLFVWLILLRYRSGLPLAILALLIEQLGRTGAGLLRMLAGLLEGGAPPAAGGWINLGMTLLLIVALLMSLRARRTGVA